MFIHTYFHILFQVEVRIDFLLGDAAAILASNQLGGRKFDFIHTSNLCDHMSLLAILLLSQPYLRG